MTPLMIVSPSGKNRKRRRKGEQALLQRIEQQLAVGSWLVGGAAGVLRGLYGGEDLGLMLWAILGLLMVAAAGAVGSALGLLLRLLLQRGRKQDEDAFETLAHLAVEGDATEMERGGKSSGGAHGANHVGSFALGSFVGGFIGVVGTLVAGFWATAPYGAAAGALVLSCILAIYGDLVRVILLMLARDSVPAEDDDDDDMGQTSGQKR